MDTDYAWAAGFIDGEGSISIKRYFRNRKNGRYIYYQPFVCASQARILEHPKAIHKLHKMFGGSVSGWERKNPNQNPMIQWSVVSLDALNCVNKILPFLLIKRPSAELIQRFFVERDKIKGGSGKVKLTKEELEKRESFYWESRSLVQRGTLRLQRLSETTPKGDATV